MVVLESCQIIAHILHGSVLWVEGVLEIDNANPHVLGPPFAMARQLPETRDGPEVQRWLLAVTLQTPPSVRMCAMFACCEPDTLSFARHTRYVQWRVACVVRYGAVRAACTLWYDRYLEAPGPRKLCGLCGRSWPRLWSRRTRTAAPDGNKKRNTA